MEQSRVNRMRVASRLLAGTSLFLGLCAFSLQDQKSEAGQKLLSAVDAGLSRANTLRQEVEVTNQEPGKDEKKLTQTIYSKGAKKLIEFTSPADMAGTKILILSPDQMYVYLPAFGKVRRIANGVNSGFMGMAFSPSDLGVIQYSSDYLAEVASDAPQESTLVLAAKPGKVLTFPKIEMTILKKPVVPVMLKYFDAKGVHVKTETFGEYTAEAGVDVATEVKMVDHTLGGHSTRMVRKSLKVNEDLSDELFTKQHLDK